MSDMLCVPQFVYLTREPMFATPQIDDKVCLCGVVGREAVGMRWEGKTV